MTIKKAVNHFIFKFNKVWNATEADKDALKAIMSFVEQNIKKQVQDNHLFAKLYIYTYASYLEKYKATVFDEVPKKELYKLLDLPLSYFFQSFTKKLNESELYDLLSESSDLNKHPLTKTYAEKKTETDNLYEAVKNKENLEKLLGQVWDLDTVTENLKIDINNALEHYG